MTIDGFFALCSESSAAIGTLPSETLLAGALFSMGLGGSVAHCATMCGPLVLGQAARGRPVGAAPLPCGRMTQKTGSFLVAYHAGRLTTYAGLGAASAFVGGAISSLPLFRHVSAVILVLTGIVLIAQSCNLLRSGVSRGKPSRLINLLRAAAQRLAGPSTAAQFGLGLIMGFLPCGLLYGAIATAASAPSVVSGGFGLVAFGLATTPMLMTISRFGAWAFTNASAPLHRLRGGFIAANGLLLFGLAWQRFAGA